MIQLLKPIDSMWKIWRSGEGLITFDKEKKDYSILLIHTNFIYVRNKGGRDGWRRETTLAELESSSKLLWNWLEPILGDIAC